MYSTAYLKRNIHMMHMNKTVREFATLKLDKNNSKICNIKFGKINLEI